MQQTDIVDLPRTNRLTLVHNEYLSEYDGRLSAGTVVLVDDRTARRWLDKGIAVPSAETDKTLREQKLAELARLQAEIDAIGSEDMAPVTRAGGAPSEREVLRPRRGTGAG